MMRPEARFIAACMLAGVIACTGCTKVTTGTGAAPHAAAAGPIPGVLRYAEVSEPDSLSTLLSTQIVTADLSYLMFSYFFNFDEHDNFVPEIAMQVPTLAN
ncbi:MAG: hypothetical protein JO343_09770, partial [Candidatus Eremiobacteraeota bacterium]|nr:hypothetical protein [Candidatus Eremiobacteraeota bacterium]